MRILIYSPAFLPHIGGLEINTALLADQLSRLGQEVVVATTTPGDGRDEAPYRIVRNPSRLALLRLVRWCQVFLQQNISLRGLWPLLLVRRPWVVSHHSWYCRSDGHIAWQDRLKRWLLHRAAASIAVSRAIADDLNVPSEVIANPYRDRIFRELPGIERTGELIFLGRLVSDKGVDILLDALALLAGRGLRPRLTLVGDGPERPALAAQAARLGLDGQIEFLGTRTDKELAELLHRHRILVVPSRYNEPFGIVVLEGIACGCLPVVSSGGGLPEAVGPCGLTFPNGDAAALASVLEPLLRDPEAGRELLRRAPEHLARHTAGTVSRAYLAVLERAVEEGAR
jgi:glycogen synthase